MATPGIKKVRTVNVRNFMVKANGLEPSTLCTSSRYSSQLSYASM